MTLRDLTERDLTGHRLALFYGAFFLFIGLHTPFWPAWLKSRGMSEMEIGLLLAAALWVRVVASPLIARAADKRGAHKQAIVVTCAAAAACYLLYAPADGFALFFAVTLVVGVALAGVMPLAETLAMAAVAQRGVDYGRMRLWGSITFIVAATLGGRVLAGGPDSAILWLLVATLALTFLASLALPDIRRPEAAVPARAPIRRLLANRGFIAFLVCGGLTQASHAVYYGFATLHWRAAGHGDDLIGLLWAEGVIAEIVLFAVSGRAVRRLGPVRLLALAAAAGVVRWSVLGATTGLAALVAVNFLHAATFGAAHLAAMHFIARAVPGAISRSTRTPACAGTSAFVTSTSSASRSSPANARSSSGPPLRAKSPPTKRMRTGAGRGSRGISKNAGGAPGCATRMRAGSAS